MTHVLNGYQPAAVLGYFADICQIPHGSGNEAQIASYLCAFAKEHGLSYREDALHNVLIRKPASAGYEGEPAILLQGHTDMVCQKNADKVHDFEKDPLTLQVTDGWISADGTTLGGDDGIAVAMMLSILADDTLCHPALECLFTVQEETGLEGAAGFDYSDIAAKLLINLDSEDEGIGTVSCAGGIRCDITRAVSFTEEESAYAVIRVDGLKGGHSGVEINMHRANAHRVIGTVLGQLAEQCDFRLCALSGGNMDNAIPRTCEAVIAYNKGEDAKLREILPALCQAQEAVFSEADRAEGKISSVWGEGRVSVMRAVDSTALLGLLNLTVDGVVSMCEDLPSLVESSCNMGILRTEKDRVVFGFLARSSVETRKEEIRQKLALCAALCGAEIVYSSAYPGWAYDKNSAAAKRYADAYEKLFGAKPKLEAIHAGLECGLIQHAVPGLSAVSIGPDMRDIHTPKERISIASIARVYETVLEMLRMKSEN